MTRKGVKVLLLTQHHKVFGSCAFGDDEIVFALEKLF